MSLDEREVIWFTFGRGSSGLVWSTQLSPCLRGALPSSAGELSRARTFVSFSQVSEGVEPNGHSRRRRRSVDLMALMPVGYWKTPCWRKLHKFLLNVLTS